MSYGGVAERWVAERGRGGGKESKHAGGAKPQDALKGDVFKPKLAIGHRSKPRSAFKSENAAAVQEYKKEKELIWSIHNQFNSSSTQVLVAGLRNIAYFSECQQAQRRCFHRAPWQPDEEAETPQDETKRPTPKTKQGIENHPNILQS